MLSYQGGKSKVGKWIVEYIPKNIKIYAEPFSGMFWTYFNLEIEKFEHLKEVIYNDVNPLNSNLMACSKKYEEFYKFLKNQDCQVKGKAASEIHKKMFYEFQKEIYENQPKLNEIDPDYDSAVKYSYVLTQVFSGSDPQNSKFIDLKGNYHSKFDSFRKKMNFTNHGKSLKPYLDRITKIENLDFEKLMLKYDSDHTFYYLDPPYYECEHYYSNHDFGLKDHERLANSLKELKSKWALSYYYFDDLEKWFPKNKYNWVQKDFNKASGATKGKAQTKGTELLIMNYA